MILRTPLMSSNLVRELLMPFEMFLIQSLLELIYETVVPKIQYEHLLNANSTALMNGGSFYLCHLGFRDKSHFMVIKPFENISLLTKP